MTPSQKQALESLWNEFGLEADDQFIDIPAVFQNNAPSILEIGFGNGESLLKQAVAEPNFNFIGIEVHAPGVGHLMSEAKQLSLKNLRIYQHDAVEVLTRNIPDATLDKIQIFFPDPWPKKRHHKRRLIQSDFVALLVRKLKSDGVLHCATDWEHYAEQMMDVLSASDLLVNTEGEGCFYSDPYSLRPKTKFENRGLRLNHVIRDLVFRKNTSH